MAFTADFARPSPDHSPGESSGDSPGGYLGPDAYTSDAVPVAGPGRRRAEASVVARLMAYLPRGDTLDDVSWRRRHAILQWLLLLHLPALTALGFALEQPPLTILYPVAPVAVFRLLGGLPVRRRLASFFTTAGLVYCSAALVALTNGAIEAHFHFFVVIGFIALYEDWIPFAWTVLFTVLSHGIGSAFQRDLMFDHEGGMQHPWTWSLIHGVAVLAACTGVVLFWRIKEQEQQRVLALTRELGAVEISRRRFTTELLINLARRNQSLLYRQLDLIGQLENAERDPEALAGLFRLDHLGTRIRRNAENLLVLAGEEPPRVWGKPVPLNDVVRAAIAETEDLGRVTFLVDERLSVLGHAVIDLTHLLAELIENAVRSSPPESQVTIRTNPDVRSPGTTMLTVEDWGAGMPDSQLADANRILAQPRDVDALAANRLGLHVVSRLASRYEIKVILSATSGSGVTAVVLLPAEIFTSSERPRSVGATGPYSGVPAAISPPPALGPVRISGPSEVGPDPAPGSTTPLLALPLSAGSLAGLPFATVLESGPLPQRNPGLSTRTAAGANGANNSAHRPGHDSLDPRAGLMNGTSRARPSGPAPGPVVPSKPVPSTGPASGPAIGPANAAVTGPRDGAMIFLPTPAAGIPAAPSWDGWWERERPTAEATTSPEVKAEVRPQVKADVTPQVTAEPMAEIKDDKARADAPAGGIVRGVAMKISNERPVPASPPRSASALPPPPGSSASLARRTPQTHLIPELKRDQQPHPGERAASPSPVPPRDPDRTREALSRFQAAQRAAPNGRDTTENDAAEEGGTQADAIENDAPDQNAPGNEP